MESIAPRPRTVSAKLEIDWLRGAIFSFEEEIRCGSLVPRGPEPKPVWRHLPKSVRGFAADALGVGITSGMRAWGGYSPSPTFRLRLADGRRVFLKGCAPDASEFMRGAFAQEVRVYTQLLGPIAKWAPTLQAHFSLDGWQVLILEDLGPKTVPPWAPSLTRSVMHSFAKFHLATRNADLPVWVPRPEKWLAAEGHRWGWTTNLKKSRQRARVAGLLAEEACDWFMEIGPRLASVCDDLVKQSNPQLLHGDLRSDNLRWRNNQLYLFDWAEVIAGAPEFDAVFFAQSIAVESGLVPETILGWYEEIAPLHQGRLDAAVCVAAGFFADRAWREEIPGLPRLRAFQRQQLVVSLNWALRRLATRPPNWLEELGRVAGTTGDLLAKPDITLG